MRCAGCCSRRANTGYYTLHADSLHPSMLNWAQSCIVVDGANANEFGNEFIEPFNRRTWGDEGASRMDGKFLIGPDGIGGGPRAYWWVAKEKDRIVTFARKWRSSFTLNELVRMLSRGQKLTMDAAVQGDGIAECVEVDMPECCMGSLDAGSFRTGFVSSGLKIFTLRSSPS